MLFVNFRTNATEAGDSSLSLRLERAQRLPRGSLLCERVKPGETTPPVCFLTSGRGLARTAPSSLLVLAWGWRGCVGSEHRLIICFGSRRAEVGVSAGFAVGFVT